MRQSKRRAGQGRTQEFPRLLGGRLCMHFVNTIEGQTGDQPFDFLISYVALARWSYHAGVLTQADAERLLDTAVSWQADAADVFEHAVQLRRALDGVFRGIARTRAPREQDLAVLQHAYAEALSHAHLTPLDNRFAWSWDHRPDQLTAPLWPVTQSAVDVLTAGQLHRIRECAPCGWLFYDTSKNGTRRWCSMEGCGSKAKARRQYERQKAQRHTKTRDR